MLTVIRKIFFSLCAAVVTLAALWAAGLILYGTMIMRAAPQNPEEVTDALIVATGGQNRILEGVRLLDDKKAKLLLISGVNEGVHVETLTGPNPPCCITLGYRAQNTRENAQESLDWIKKNNVKSFRLITSDYHMPRAYLEFRHLLGDDIEILKHPVREKRHKVFSRDFLKLVFEEYHKYLATWIDLRTGESS